MNWKTITLLMLLALTLTGCGSTKIPVEVERPSTLNTTGIKRIAIMPFEIDNPSYGGVASYATTAVANKVRETNRFTLVDASEILRLQENNQSVESYVDAMFIGRITQANVKQDSSSTQFEDEKGNISHFTVYSTKVEIEFNYSLKVARDGRLIGPISRKGSKSDYGTDGYPSAEELLKQAITPQINLIRQDIASYKSKEMRTFAKDKTGNNAVSLEMDEALKHVKEQNYKLALQAYLGIYERHKSIAAAENASIVYEALGDIESALKIMQKVYDDTGNPSVQRIIARLNKDLADKEKLAASEQEESSSVEKVSAFACEEIQKVSPSKLWLYNNSPGNPMVEDVIDHLAASLLRKGISIVERDSENTELIATEQKLQLSGAVSDDDAVKLGNAAGAKTIAIIGMKGQGAMRRLQVRVLDIEKGTKIMQSDASEKWQM